MASKAPEGNPVRWRCADVKAGIEKRFKGVLHEPTVGFLLHRVVFRKKVRREKDGKVVLRLSGIANVLEGLSRQDAAHPG